MDCCKSRMLDAMSSTLTMVPLSRKGVQVTGMVFGNIISSVSPRSGRHLLRMSGSGNYRIRLALTFRYPGLNSFSPTKRRWNRVTKSLFLTLERRSYYGASRLDHSYTWRDGIRYNGLHGHLHCVFVTGIIGCLRPQHTVAGGR